MKYTIRIAAALLCLAAAVPAVHAQTSGSISGTIADKQGAVISGAKVLLSDQQQGAQRRIVTDAQGNFVFTPIPPST